MLWMPALWISSRRETATHAPRSLKVVLFALIYITVVVFIQKSFLLLPIVKMHLLP